MIKIKPFVLACHRQKHYHFIEETKTKQTPKQCSFIVFVIYRSGRLGFLYFLIMHVPTVIFLIHPTYNFYCLLTKRFSLAVISWNLKYFFNLQRVLPCVCVYVWWKRISHERERNEKWRCERASYCLHTYPVDDCNDYILVFIQQSL